MTPVTFTCRATVRQTPDEILAGITDLARWAEFEGFGILPGIEEARWETRTEDMVGSRIAVRNTDGSSHVEEIRVWEPERVVMVLQDFVPPLSRIATHFVEEWRLERVGEETRVARGFEMHPRDAGGRAALWGISLLLRQAIAKQLREMAAEGEAASG